jgi:hypothetical protein
VSISEGIRNLATGPVSPAQTSSSHRDAEPLQTADREAKTFRD